ncbi:MAG: HAD family hydrolase, partial [Bacilli bacterium]|nr:HAD family hydrolase [Bacilli bacterium]
IVSAKKGGITEVMAQQSTLVDTLHFESERQYMASLYQSAEGFVVYMKGSVEKILERCDWMMNIEGEKRAIDKALVIHHAETMATSGLRILAFAKLCLSEKVDVLEHKHLENGLIFLGLQGMMDPPRVGVNEAVQRCYEAGVEVKMITGDHGVTALAIAKAIGIKVNTQKPFLTGKEMDVYSDAQLLGIIKEVNVFARIAPEQKLRLVKALQAHDEIVAMTGDGVNDAPALRQANIGIAMGISGTEVAKESADMILADDNFLSIKDAIEEGRVVYDNLIKFITWILPTNVGEGLVIIVAICFGVSLPLLPLQILWINMLSDSALGIMLAYEPKEKALMQNPPRSPQTPIMSQALLFRVLLVGCLLFIHAFGAFFYTLSLGVDDMVARTLVINIFVFGEMLYLFNCRSFHYSVFKIGFFSNPYLLYAMLVVGGLQFFLTYHPWMNTLFNTAPMGWFEWGIVFCSSLLIYGIVEVEKYFTCKKRQTFYFKGYV